MIRAITLSLVAAALFAGVEWRRQEIRNVYDRSAYAAITVALLVAAVVVTLFALPAILGAAL